MPLAEFFYSVEYTEKDSKYLTENESSSSYYIKVFESNDICRNETLSCRLPLLNFRQKVLCTTKLFNYKY